MGASHWQMKTEDGLGLYAVEWIPEGEMRGAICLFHGLGEHSGRYEHVAEFMNRNGYGVLAIDLRGHGNSEGQRGHSPGIEGMLNDLDLLINYATEKYSDQPLFLYGHSLGGNLVLHYGLKRSPLVNGIVITSPFLRAAFEPAAWKITLGKVMYTLWPSLSLGNELDPSALSKDQAVVDAYVQDPLVHDRVTSRMGIDMLNTGEWALENAASFPLPLLLMHGGGDRVCSPEASREFALKAGKICTLKMWDGLAHELHNEPEKEKVLSYMLQWITGNT